MTDAGARPWASSQLPCYFVVVEPLEEPAPVLAPPTSSFAGLLALLLGLEPDEPADPPIDDLLADRCAAFFADSYSDLLNWPSLFLSYCVNVSARPGIDRASSMLMEPLLSASTFLKLGHSLALLDLSAANVATDTAETAKANAAVTADFTMMFMRSLLR